LMTVHQSFPNKLSNYIFPEVQLLILFPAFYRIIKSTFWNWFNWLAKFYFIDNQLVQRIYIFLYFFGNVLRWLMLYAINRLWWLLVSLFNVFFDDLLPNPFSLFIFRGKTKHILIRLFIPL
jgi:hypothetical protein